MKWFIKKENNNFNFERLLQVNGKDPAIFTKKSSNNLVDLFGLCENKKIYRFLFSNETELLIENKDITKNLLDELKNIDNLDDLISFCEFNNFELTSIELNKLSKNFSTAKKSIIENKITKSQNNLLKKINQLEIANKQNLINENIYTLYLGAYFINAKINDINLNAPLLLYKVKITYRANNILISKLDQAPILNEKLNFLLSKEFKIKFDFKDDVSYKQIYNYEKYLASFLNNQSFFTDNFYYFSSNVSDNFNVQKSVCLMLIEPTGGIIKKDIEAILAKRINPFNTNTKVVNTDEYENKIVASDNLIEVNQKLNIYQKYAIHSALTQNTLIYGPPGTGKSEVLANIVVNLINMVDNKFDNVLIASEKKVALNILWNRIGCLNCLALDLSSENYDDFYEQLKNYKNFLDGSIKKVNPKTSNKQYQELLNLYNELFDLLQIKLDNNISFNNFLASMSNLNLLDFAKYSDNNTINLINDILKKQKINLDNFYLLVNNFKMIANNYSDELNILLMHKNFCSFDSKTLNEFIEKYNNSGKQDFVLSALITKNKIITKKPLFNSTQKLVLDLNQDRMLELLSQLSKLNLNNLTRDEIILLKTFNLNKDVVEKFLIYDSFLNGIKRNKYLKLSSLQELSYQYLLNRDQNIKLNDQLIYEKFMFNKFKQIDKLNKEKKERIFKLFGLAYLNNKPSMNLVIKEYFEELKFLFPIWFGSPESICVLTPNKQDLFDYGIFDEASQMFVEKAFPLVYRTKIKIVAGDDKQLQPTSFFMKKADNDSLDLINTESLFEIANVCLWTKFYLKNHYRSKAAELIKFSNEYFYDNKLEFSTYNGFNMKPIVVYDVDGVWEDNHNTKEIEQIINILNNDKTLLNKKVLVISFNSIQSKLLNEAFVKFFAKSKNWMSKYQEGSISFFALEEVQGNEADVVILSVSYAKDNSQKLRHFFGPLSQKNGGNRLNVAITRAKEQMIIVKSINSGDIKVSENENNNIFKYYLAYCEQIATNKNKATNTSNNNNQIEFINDYILDNIITYLKSLNNDFNNQDQYKFIKNYIIGNKLIDIGIYNQKSKQFIFALKINNNLNLNLKNNIQFLDEVHFLADLNYDLYTFNVIDWFLKNKLIQQEIAILVTQKKF